MNVVEIIPLDTHNTVGDWINDCGISATFPIGNMTYHLPCPFHRRQSYNGQRIQNIQMKRMIKCYNLEKGCQISREEAGRWCCDVDQKNRSVVRVAKLLASI